MIFNNNSSTSKHSLGGGRRVRSGSSPSARGPQRSRWRQKQHTSWCPPETKLLALGLLAATTVLLSAVYVARPSVWSSTKSRISSHYRRHRQQHNHNDHHQQHQHELIRGGRNKHQAEKSNLQNRQHQPISDSFRNKSPEVDAVVVGSGLAGMAATLHILDRGGRVILIEKEETVGGNSNKASSGMNACCLPEDRGNNDTIDSFRDDTIKSAGGPGVARHDLIDALVSKSASAVNWLRQRGGVDLSQLVQLGGHSHKRTHRPAEGFVGAEIISSLSEALEAYREQRKDQFRLLVGTRVTRILKDESNNGQVVMGVECQQIAAATGANGEQLRQETLQIRSDHVILATGGFASDRSTGSYLSKYRPELMNLPATAGPFSTGDGITLASSLAVGLRDMDKIQIHPTGFVDPVDRKNPNKHLAAELLRGIGGVLLNHKGHRFCNELGTRAYITDRMLSENPKYAQSKKWDAKAPIPTFYLVLSDEAAKEGNKHVTLYTHKGLMRKLEGIEALAEFTGISKDMLISTLTSYRDSATRGKDEFDKAVFNNVPKEALASETFHVGEVIPVLHYCMGGIAIDTEGSVLSEKGEIIPGLYGAGEVTGGVHGNNRLGGNSLLECAVFGTIVGERIPLMEAADQRPQPLLGDHGNDEGSDRLSNLPIISATELAKHNTPEDCWLAVHGKVYDLTSFAPKHPGKAQPILNFAGKDATGIFGTVHSTNILTRMQDNAVGLWSSDSDTRKAIVQPHPVSLVELKRHNTPEDLWIAIHGNVYDLTEFADFHPGGSHLITKFAGRDATDSFQGFHPPYKLKLVEPSVIGPLVTDGGVRIT